MKPAVIWLTGLSASGKTSLAEMAQCGWQNYGKDCIVIDGDFLQKHVVPDLGFSLEDRAKRMQVAAQIAVFEAKMGRLPIVAMISPIEKERQAVARYIRKQGVKFFLIALDTDYATCAKRDIKGLYRKAARGEIKHFTGVTSPYERPKAPHLRLDAANGRLEVNYWILSKYLSEKSIIPNLVRWPWSSTRRKLSCYFPPDVKA